MKQIYKKVLKFNLGNGYFSAAIWPLHYKEVEPFESRIVTSWEEALEMVKIFDSEKIIRTKKSILGKTLIQIWNTDWTEWATISEKKFKSISFRFEVNQKNNYSLEQLVKELPANEFIEYLQDMEDLLIQNYAKKIINNG